MNKNIIVINIQIDNIFSTNYWYSNGYEFCSSTYFLQGLIKHKDRKLAQIFNSSFRYIDDVLSLNNSRFGNDIYTSHLSKWTCSYGYYWYSKVCFLSSYGGRLKTKLHDKRNDFTFPIVNFPFISSNIPASPAYGV